ncbi:hypothetical protein CHARACLAT_025751 [Characodon lateralis]|uniref:Hexosyltransferase n=1 Tax=Characodon lateralis TaxID=208331 RepID=A0ABU7F637_9TELE|nr:hypothetical protein [Characodon lateralis]
MESYHIKCEKAPWKGSRRWLYFAMLSLMMGVLIFYSWSSLALSPSLGWREDSLSSYSDGNKTTAVESISPHHLPSQFFVEYPHQYHFILDEPNRCRQESPFLVVIIPVAPQSREARDIIRSTWGKETQVFGQLVSYYFLLGKSRIGNDTEPLDEQVI